MIKLEAQKRYFTRAGTMTDALVLDVGLPGRIYCFTDPRTNKSWTVNGEVYIGETNKFDIVHEFTDLEYKQNRKIYNTKTGSQLVVMDGGL